MILCSSKNWARPIQGIHLYSSSYGITSLTYFNGQFGKRSNVFYNFLTFLHSAQLTNFALITKLKWTVQPHTHKHTYIYIYIYLLLPHISEVSLKIFYAFIFVLLFKLTAYKILVNAPVHLVFLAFMSSFRIYSYISRSRVQVSHGISVKKD